MKLYNAPQIKAEDFPEDDRQTVEMLGNSLNPFMQQVTELTDGRIDFENLLINLKTIDVIVDASGVPTLNNKLRTGKVGIRGFSVINAVSVNDNTNTATTQPFIAKYTGLGGDLVELNKITGLPANVLFRLTIVIY